MALGIASGLALGAAAAAAASPSAPYTIEGPVTADEIAYCSRRYRSYDPETGTFLGHDGLRHPCP